MDTNTKALEIRNPTSEIMPAEALAAGRQWSQPVAAISVARVIL